LYSKRIGPDKVKLTRVVLDIERVSAFKTWQHWMINVFSFLKPEKGSPVLQPSW
jgi:hypothetical protein